MKVFRHIHNHFRVPSRLTVKSFIRVIHLDAISNHSLTEPQPLDLESSEWCERAYSKLIKLSHLLQGLDLINGRLVNVKDKRVVNDEFLIQNMHTFKSISTNFLRYHSLQHTLSATSTGVSAQHRKLVRLAICPQVTQHQIWTGTLIEILNQLYYEMTIKDNGCVSKGFNMGQQIVVNCRKFLDDVESYDPDSTSWMRVAPKKDTGSQPSAKWDDLLEMFNDLINCLKNDHEFLFYVVKLETMKEGLSQIKDVLVDKNIGYKEARHQQSLVHKKLSKSLGHSSRCLFTLLLYYLYGSIRDIEVDICCWFSEGDSGNDFIICVGKILTSDGEKMIKRAVKQLDRALGVIKFVHEMAQMNEVLDYQGHIWCLGSESRSFTYRGRSFFIHGISLY
ncbi:uncharacterized protein [Rutidosis leptorrhynchoides]|uniref:uncharacterized protein isoform X2 n=1 Tax=Rutidosis leptorrhynchoides TaxID=125765 RepID=UPI003A998B19